jgi:phage tail-like protein
MHNASKNNYFFLNREGRWPRFHRSGIEVRADGALQLISLPLNSGAPLGAAPPAPEGPAGIAVDITGTLYFTDPDSNRVMRIDGCDGNVAPAPCMGGMSGQPAQFRVPRGLFIPSRRRTLMVADSGNHRIQIFDLDTSQLVEIWGQANPGATPRPGTLPGQFDTPWTMDEDAEGSCYVVDYGNRRVQKFNAIGDVVPSFCDNVAVSGLLHRPADIALRRQDGETWIFVVDAASATIFIFDTEGRPVRDAKGQPRFVVDSHMQRPMGIAVAGPALYVGDNAVPGVLRFEIDDAVTFAGVGIDYTAPVAALRLAGSGTLWVHPGDSFTPHQLMATGGFGASGILWSDPIEVVDRTVVWHRVLALAEPLAENAHLDLYAYAASSLADAPPVNPSAANPFADHRWQSIVYGANLDVTDLYIGGQQSKYLWIGATFSGDGTVSPIVRQLRVEFDYPIYDRYLPAIYREQQCGNEFLLRLLSLFESMYAGMEHKITSLPALFDPEAAPANFLPWLASCLGLDLDESWSEEKQRSVIAEIFRLSGQRGTVAGLRDALRIFAGIDAVIEEPILNAAWWSMPAAACCDACAADAASTSPPDTGSSILGWTTMLAPAQPQGAVVGTSADLGQSHLITDHEFGAPLFSDVAYRFSVQIYRSQAMSETAVAKIRAVLDREKPAHTVYHLCVIDPRLRVGFQSRVGVDTVVGGPPRSLSLESGQRLGEDTALAGAAASRLGVQSQLGLNMRLA